MLEGITNGLDQGIEFVHALVVSPRSHAERIIKDDDVREREESLRIVGTFGRLALSDFRRRDMDYHHLLGEFKYEMIQGKHKFKLEELGLSEHDHEVIGILTGLE